MLAAEVTQGAPIVSLVIEPLSPALGAEAKGIDLADSPAEASLDALRRALLDHLVLVIRAQSFTPAQYLEAAGHFGTPMRQHYSQYLMEGFPDIGVLSSRTAETDASGRRHLLGTGTWHTDHTNHEAPPKLTILHAVEMPPTGGDTSFANMRKAYDSLSEDRKRHFEGLRTINTLDAHAGRGEVPTLEADKRRHVQRVSHPLIRTHPENGTKAVYFHPTKTERVEGWDQAESHAFVDGLVAELIRPGIVYRHKWRVGDMLLCDNRSTMHVAHRDYDPDEGRTVHRIIVKGDRPS